VLTERAIGVLLLFPFRSDVIHPFNSVAVSSGRKFNGLLPPELTDWIVSQKVYLRDEKPWIVAGIQNTIIAAMAVVSAAFVYQSIIGLYITVLTPKQLRLYSRWSAFQFLWKTNKYVALRSLVVGFSDALLKTTFLVLVFGTCLYWLIWLTLGVDSLACSNIASRFLCVSFLIGGLAQVGEQASRKKLLFWLLR
jgi:hypothetical protein